MTTALPTGRVAYKPDEADRELLNQLQAGLAIVREPYAEIGSRIGMDEEEVLRRLQRLKDAAIVRQLSAIFDTRALGYASSLVAARVPGGPPVRGRRDRQRAPGREPQLQAQPRVQPLVHARRAARLAPRASRTTIDGCTERPAPTSTRMLPTLKLYKIGVKLDMTGTSATDAKEDAPRPAAGARRRRAADRGRQGDDRDPRSATCRSSRAPSTPGRPRPASPRTSCSPPAEVFVERSYMRRFAAVLNHRKAGFGANGMAVWAVPEEELEEIGPAHGRLPGRLALLQAADLPRLAVQHLHDGPRSARKEACEEAIAAIAEETGITDPRPAGGPLLDLRVQEDPAHVLHAGLPRVGGPGRWRAHPFRGGGTEHRRTTPQRRAVRPGPPGAGGRRELAGPRDARPSGATRSSSPRAEGPDVWDADGRRYVDYLSSWGPAILGHAPRRRAERRSATPCRSAPPTARRPSARCSSPRWSCEAMPSVEQLRMTSSGQRGRDGRAAPGARGDRARRRRQGGRRIPRRHRRAARRGRQRRSPRSACPPAPA